MVTRRERQRFLAVVGTVILVVVATINFWHDCGWWAIFWGLVAIGLAYVGAGLVFFAIKWAMAGEDTEET